MANMRIIDLPTASSLASSTYMVGDNSGSEGTVKFTFQQLLEIFYPVGSYYETSDANFNPNTAWGGTWVLDSKGRVTVGYDPGQTEFNSIGKTDGEKMHQLTVSEMPAHYHSRIVFYNNGEWTVGDGTGIGGKQTDSHSVFMTNVGASDNSELSHYSTNAAGGYDAHNNLQPYIVVNRWHRTA